LLIIKTTHLAALANNLLTASVSYLNFLNLHTRTKGEKIKAVWGIIKMLRNVTLNYSKK